jgi:hypothetical protein
MLKSTLDSGFALAKNISAPVNLWVIKMNGKTTKREKMNLCL